VLTVTGGIGDAEPDAALAGEAAADAPELPAAGGALLPLLEPLGAADSLLPQAVSVIESRLAANHKIALGTGIERVVFIV
jgi:hypothetical protein